MASIVTTMVDYGIVNSGDISKISVSGSALNNLILKPVQLSFKRLLGLLYGLRSNRTVKTVK